MVIDELAIQNYVMDVEIVLQGGMKTSWGQAQLKLEQELGFISFKICFISPFRSGSSY